ncbi:MAG: hypothetical protein AABY50_05720 [Nitrospirota bacterium]
MKEKSKDDVVMKQLEKKIENMSLERRGLFSELIERYKSLDIDELRRELRYILYVKNTLRANRRNKENLNLGSCRGNAAS